MTKLEILLDKLKDISEEEIPIDYEFKVGDLVYVDYFTNPKLTVNNEMVDMIKSGKAYKIQSINTDHNYYLINQWAWTKDSLTLKK